MHLIHHSISIHFVKTLINAAAVNGLNCEALLKAADLNSNMLKNTQLRITPDQFSRFMRALWFYGNDEFLGLASEPTKHGVFTLMAKQAVNCPNLNTVYRHICHFYNLVTNGITLNMKVENELVYFSMELAEDSLDPDYSLREFLMLVWHRFPSWLIGQQLPLKSIALAYPEPKHINEYRLMYPCPAIFNSKANTLVFEAKYLNMPVVQTPKFLRAYLKRAPLDWFKRQAYFHVFTQRVVSYLQSNVQIASTNMGTIAAQLHVTTRTLRRKLKDEGTSFQTLKDDVRRDTAIHLLSQPNIPISTISRQLGFSEPSVFTRAFKLWTGVSPKIYRGK